MPRDRASVSASSPTSTYPPRPSPKRRGGWGAPRHRSDRIAGMDFSETPAPAPRFVSDLDTLIRARYPLIYLVSWEEQRLDGILQDVAQNHGKSLLTWSITRGLRRGGGARPPATPRQAAHPLGGLHAHRQPTEAP